MEITPHIAKLILKDHLPDRNDIEYKSHIVNGNELRIIIIDSGGWSGGARGSRISTYTTQYVAIPDILNHPIIIQYNRKLKLDNII